MTPSNNGQYEYYNLRKKLNREQQEFFKDIEMKKIKDIRTLIYLFLIGGAGSGKFFIVTTIFQALIYIYKNCIDSDLDKPKGLITAHKGKTKYDICITTLHSTLYIPFNKSELIPLRDTINYMYSS